MSDLVKRALQVLGNATVNQGKEYTSNVTSFINDAKDVHNMIIRQTTDVADTYTRLKNTNFTKKISDWFYQKEAESDLDAAEEFDSGMKPSADMSESDKDGDTVSRPLTTESMTDIFEKSTAAAYKIGRKQTEQSVINTSEIVSTFNSRSSEIITSINNVNRTLIDIRTTLDNLAKAYGAVNTASGSGGKNNTEDMSSLYSGGQLSLARIFEASKSSFARNSYVEGAQTMMRYIMEGGPEGLAQFGISALLNRIKVPGSDKSIDELAKGINESIGNAIQTGLSEAIGSKWFKAVFGDIAKTETGFDYGSLVKNSYDNKRATFDGMTRMSIVTLIPEMLAKINESLSGKSYHVDNTGHWAAGPVTDDFMKVTGNAFASSGINIKARTAISNAGMRSVGKQIPDEDIELAGEALTGMLVNYIVNEEGTTNFTISMLKSMDSSEIISDATMMCVNASKHGDVKYWAKVCQTILLTLTSDMTQSHKFVTNVNTSARSMMDAAKDFAQSGRSNAHQARTITKSLMQAQFLNSKSGSNSVYTGSNPDVNLFANKAGAGGSVVDGRVNNDRSKPKHTLHQYVEGIYGILNRGINVKVSKKKGAFPDYAFGQGGAKTNEDDTLARVFLSGAAGGKSDEQNLKNIVKMSIQETTDSLLGNNSDNQPGLLGALLGSNGFLGNVVGSFGAETLRGITNGNIRDNMTQTKRNISNTISNVAGGIVDAVDFLTPGIIKNNRNAIALKDRLLNGGIEDAGRTAGGYIAGTGAAIADFGKNVGNKVSAFANDVLGNTGVGRLANKAAYAADSRILKLSEQAIKDYVPPTAEEKTILDHVMELKERGLFGAAKERAADLKDKSLRDVVFKELEIHQKRVKGEYAVANGQLPSIGAVADQTFVNAQSKQKPTTTGGKIVNVVSKGLKSIGSMLKNIYTFLFKVFKDGAMDVFYGAKSMISGWKTLLEKVSGLAIKGISAISKGIGYIAGLGYVIGKKITSAVTGLFKKIAPTLSKIVSKVGEIVSTIATIGKSLGKVVLSIGGAVKTLVTSGTVLLKNALEPLTDKLKGLFGNGPGIIGSFFGGLTEGFKEKRLEKAKEKDPLVGDIHDKTTKISEILSELRDSIVGTEKSSDPDAKKGFLAGLTSKLSGIFGFGKKNEKETVDLSSNKSDASGEDAAKASITKVSESTTTAGAAAAAEGAEAGGGAGAALGVGATIAKALGKVLGGPMQIIVGVLKMVLSTVMGFTVVKELIKDVKEIFTTAVKQLKPLIVEVANVVKKFMPAVKVVMDTIVDALKSLIEPLIPVTEELLKTLIPVVVGGVKLVSKIVVPPLVWIAEKAMPPIVKGITKLVRGVEIGVGWIKKICGHIQHGIGRLEQTIGNTLEGIGWFWEAISPSADGGGNWATKAGGEIWGKGDKHVRKGNKLINEANKLIEGNFDDLVDNSNPRDYSGTVDTSKVGLTSDFGSGDPGVTNNITNNYSYTYGSGNVTTNQHSYGNYMNMSERGCGPVALADAYARKTGIGINPRTLASSMLSSGAYIPTRGTSVTSMLTTGNALGMNLRTGGVTANSLKSASPTNPITVYGSGIGFGTRNGNGHYVNVVGNDGKGNVYVSNPLTGRVGRQNISAIVANSKLGLYGSGDADDYGFDEGTNEALSNLKALTDRLSGMFSIGGDTVVDAETESKASQISSALSDEEMAQIEDDPKYQEALEKYKAWHKIGEDESEESYGTRIKNLFRKTKTAMKLIVKLGTSMFKDKLRSEFEELETEADEIAASHQSMVDSALAGVSDIGAEMAPYSPIRYTEANISGVTSGASPVHDFFSATNGRGYDAYTINGGWYGKTDNPDKTGQGKSGSVSDGILITMPLSDGKTALIKAITGGTVTYVGKGGNSGPNANGGLGNHVKWRDSAGMYHWYYHLGSIDSKISEGSTIEPGQLIGVIGKDSDRPTGLIDEKRDAFGYTLSKIGPYGSTGDGTENPLAYWKFEQQEALSGDSEKDKIFNYLVNTIGLSTKGAAGVMGVFESESGNIAARLEGDYAFPKAFGTATKSNTALNEYTTGQLFPYYAKQGVSIDKGAYRASDGNYYPGFGLAQWTGPRGKQISDYGKSKSSNWEDLAVQLAFIREELGSSQFSGLMGAIKNPASPANAADAWMTQYEAGGSGTNPYNTWLKDNQISERRKNADSIYNAYKNKKPISSAVTTSDSEADIIGHFVSTMSNVSTGSYFASGGGAPLFTGQYTPTVTSLNITGAAKSESPLHEFFSMMTGRKKDSSNSQNSSWYGQYNNPDRNGVGHSGDPHGGIDINTDQRVAGDDEGSPLYATTGGTVVQAGWSDSAGNNILWKDSAGFYHWYMHLRDNPLKHAKDKIEGGTLLGYMGNTGNSYGAHLHYSIHSQQPAWSSDYTVNPLKYFGNYNATAGDSQDGAGSNKGGLTHNISSISTDNMTLPYSGDGPFLQPKTTKTVATTPTGPSAWWDISTWDNMTKQQRMNLYSDLARKHQQAIGKSASYATTYQQGSKDDWQHMYTAYSTGNHQDIWDTESTLAQLEELRSIVGSGDISSVSKGNIPPIDFSKLTDNMNDTVAPYVNLFNIKPDSLSKDDLLKRMSQMTFNVRAQRVEELLEDLIGIVSEGKNKVPSPNTSSNNQADPFLFNNEIPPQVTRLARG